MICRKGFQTLAGTVQLQIFNKRLTTLHYTAPAKITLTFYQ